MIVPSALAVVVTNAIRVKEQRRGERCLPAFNQLGLHCVTAGSNHNRHHHHHHQQVPAVGRGPAISDSIPSDHLDSGFNPALHPALMQNQARLASEGLPGHRQISHGLYKGHQ